MEDPNVLVATITPRIYDIQAKVQELTNLAVNLKNLSETYDAMTRNIDRGLNVNDGNFSYTFDGGGDSARELRRLTAIDLCDKMQTLMTRLKERANQFYTFL